LGSTLYVELIFVCGKEIKPMEVKKSSDDQWGIKTWCGERCRFEIMILIEDFRF
jgi:hypothetical protein